MPAVAALGTTFNLPNYTGEVLTITAADTPFLTAIGGLNGQGEVVMSRQFEGQTQDLGDPAQPAHLEGAEAPTETNRSRGTWNNVTQIFQYKFGVSYTKLAATQQLAGLAIGGAPGNPVADEIDYQTQVNLTTAARDINWTFINGAYALPVNNATARTTRGLLTAITTNVAENTTGADITVSAIEADDEVVAATAHGLEVGDAFIFTSLTGGTGASTNTVYYVVSVPDANSFTFSATRGGTAVNVTVDATAGVAKKVPLLTRTTVLDMLQLVWASNGMNSSAEPTLICNASVKRALSKAFITDGNYREQSRNVGGVNVTLIETDFGAINIMLERAMPTTTLAFAHLALCKPAYLLIPDRGFLFVEPLAKTGASDNYQLYGEVGLWHGPEVAHGKLLYVPTPASN